MTSDQNPASADAQDAADEVADAPNSVDELNQADEPNSIVTAELHGAQQDWSQGTQPLALVQAATDGAAVAEGADAQSEPVEVLDEAAQASDDDEPEETVTRPGKLIRIATMVRSMLDEVRRAPLDDAGRKALSTIHARSLAELSEVLSDDLRQELADMALPLSDDTIPTESEIRIAQAQLVGWLEGLFHGIQATMATQQAMAQAQLAQVRNKVLQPGQHDPTGSPSVGQYL